MKGARYAAALAMLAAANQVFADTTEVDIRGRATLIPSLGVSYDISGDSRLQTRSVTAHSVEFGYAVGQAKATKELRVAEPPVVLGGETFASPALSTAQLNYTSTVSLAHLAYRYRYWWTRPNLAIEGLAGLGWGTLAIKVTSNTGQGAAERLSNAGLVLGVGGAWRFASNTALQARLLAMGSSSTDGVSSAGRFDVSLVHAVSPRTNVRVGYSSVSAYSARDNDSSASSTKSPITVVARGVGVGLELVF